MCSIFYFFFNSVSLLVRPFFPSADGRRACGLEQESNFTLPGGTNQTLLGQSNQTLLDGSDQTVSDGSTLTLNSDDVPSLGWPFIICSGIHLIPAIGFLMIGKGTWGFKKYYLISAVIIRLPMPIYSEEKDVEETKNGDIGKKKNDEGPMSDAKQLVKHPKILLICGLLFCLFSCGIESSFQSQIFTFGLCGPHQLSPQQVKSTCLIPQNRSHCSHNNAERKRDRSSQIFRLHPWQPHLR